MKVFILTTITAPYRVNLFNELGKKCELMVCFEQNKDLVVRNDEWYKNEYDSFKFIKLKKWNKSLKTIKWDVFKYLKEFKPDIVIAYEYSTITALLLMSLCKIMNIPYLINCDGAIPSNNILKTLIKKHYIKNAIAYFGNGISAKKYYLKYNGKEEKIIPYKFSNYYKEDVLDKPITSTQKAQIKKKLNLNYEKVFLSVGRFEYLKGFDLLLDAIKNTHNVEKTGFVIIGGGPLEEEYRRRIKEEKINNVIILPYMDKKGLMEYYDASDVFIFPTRRDIWGLVVVEAMSRGVPVISSDESMAGIELIKDGYNGKLFKNNNLSELIEAIEIYNNMEHEKLESISNNCIFTVKDYNIETMAQTHYKAIKAIYNRKKCGEK